MHRFVKTLASVALASLCFVAPAAAGGNFGWSFTYQGRLHDAGSPVNGPLPMSFRLYDDAVAGAQVGPQLDQVVGVSGGLFTADLDFTDGGTVAGVFDGRDRWLEIEVNGTLLTPRQKLETTPHAAVASLFAVPLAMATTAPTIMHLISNSNQAQVRAFLVETNSTAIGAEAVVGIHNDPSNEGVGVAGVSYSGNGFGVSGVNLSPSGNNTGILGSSISPFGTGIAGMVGDSGPCKALAGYCPSPSGWAGYFEGRGYFTKPVGIGPAAADPQFMLHVDAGDSTNLVMGAQSDSTIGTWLGLRNFSTGGGNWALISTGSANGEGPDKLLIHNAATVTTRVTVGDDFVGIGRSDAITSAEDFGVQSPAGANSYGGMYINTAAAGGWPFYGYATGGAARAWHYFDGTSEQWKLYAGAERLVVNASDGRVGIGTSSPGFLLHVNGSAGKPGGGSWSVASDLRLKKNVAPLGHALADLLSLHGVTFEYIDPAAIDELPGERIGVIAQDVERVFPDWVEDGADGYKRVTFRGFEAVAIEALRELQAEKDREIATLRADLKAKDAALAALAARLDRLEAAGGAR